MLKKNLGWLLGLYLLAPAALCWAGAGESGAQVLLQLNGARPAAMGGAFAALSHEIYAMEINPAGLFDIEKDEIMLMHLAGFEGLTTELLAVALPVPDLGVLGGEFIFRSQPPIDNQVQGEGTVTVKDMVYGLSFSRLVTRDLSIGVNGKIIAMTLGPADAAAISLDMGARYQLDDRLSLGAAIRNLGTPVKFYEVEDPLPLTFLAGVGYTLMNQAPHQVTLALDVNYLAPEQDLILRLGGEYWFKRLMAFRMGYIYSSQATVKGFTAGIGFRFAASQQVDIVLDYALLPEVWESTDFEVENRFTLSVNF